MKTINQINVITVSTLMIMIIGGFGFTIETLMYTSIWLGTFIGVLQLLGVFIYIIKKGPNIYLSIYFLLVMATIFINDMKVFLLAPVTIVYLTLILFIKYRHHEP